MATINSQHLWEFLRYVFANQGRKVRFSMMINWWKFKFLTQFAWILYEKLDFTRNFEYILWSWNLDFVCSNGVDVLVARWRNVLLCFIWFLYLLNNLSILFFFCQCNSVFESCFFSPWSWHVMCTICISDFIKLSSVSEFKFRCWIIILLPSERNCHYKSTSSLYSRHSSGVVYQSSSRLFIADLSTERQGNSQIY